MKKKPRRKRYQDYVIKDGVFIGDFEHMYQDHDDPWHQSMHEILPTEKAIALHLLKKLRNVFGVKRATEIGCGLGHFSHRLASTGIDISGIDVSATAIQRAKDRYGSSDKNLEFIVSDFGNFDTVSALQPDCIILSEVTWYVLPQLKEFLAFLKDKLPDCFVIHILTVYEAGKQKYGNEYFTSHEEILAYFQMNYLETGLVNQVNGESHTWFLGCNNPEFRSRW